MKRAIEITNSWDKDDVRETFGYVWDKATLKLFIAGTVEPEPLNGGKYPTPEQYGKQFRKYMKGKPLIESCGEAMNASSREELLRQFLDNPDTIDCDRGLLSQCLTTLHDKRRKVRKDDLTSRMDQYLEAVDEDAKLQKKKEKKEKRVKRMSSDDDSEKPVERRKSKKVVKVARVESGDEAELSGNDE